MKNWFQWLLIVMLLFSAWGCGLSESLFEDEEFILEYYEEDEEPWEEDGIDVFDDEEPDNGISGIFESGECEYEEEYDVDLECGYVIVPENYDAPDGNQVYLAVTIIRSPGGARHADPAVYLEGGPGGSATADVESWLEQPFLNDRDLILFDQRGTGWSRPSLNCIELETGDEEELDAAQACYERLLDEDIDLTQYNSYVNAADLDALRQALGYDTWNLLGVSYGTRLALTAMRDRPQGIRSAILDSVYPPEVNAYEEESINGVRAFEMVFAGCAADAACRRAFPDLAQTLYTLLDDLQANPVEFIHNDPWTDEEEEVSLDGVELAAAIFQALYDTDTIPWIPYAIEQIVQENYEEAWILLSGGAEAPGYSRRRQELDEDLSDSEGFFYSVECYEEVPFNSAAEAAKLTKNSTSPLIPHLTPNPKSVFEICAVWDVGAAPLIETRPVQSDIPTLVLAGDYDPITPPAWAQSAARHLSNSFYFEFPGVGHGVLATECGQMLIANFLNNPRVKPAPRCLAKLGAPKFQVP